MRAACGRLRNAALGVALLIVAGCFAAPDQGLEDDGAVVAPEGREPFGQFPAQPGRRFIRVGSADGGQFDEDEFRFLAENFDYVLFTKFHAGFDIEQHHEATRRLKELNPQIRVFPYFSTKYSFEQNEFGGRPFDPAWYLRDNAGAVVERTRSNGENPGEAAYVDLANPAYREWAIETLRLWLETAPYDGVSFDAAVPIGANDPEDIVEWEGLLGQRRVEAYNAGLRTLLAEAKELVGPDREVIYNGIAPTPERGDDRTLELLEVTDGALDEQFCLDRDGEVHVLQEDLDLMASFDDRRLFLRTNYSARFPQDDRERYGRFCLGTFLMGWRPGLTYFQFGDDYTSDQLGRDVADMNIPLGTPTAAYRSDEQVLSRAFTNGEVYVNTGDRPARVVLSRALTRADTGSEAVRIDDGAEVMLPPGDAAFFLVEPDGAIPEAAG